MELRDWIRAEHDAVQARFEQSIAATVPAARWRDPAGQGGSSIAFLLFHTTYHADLAVHAVLRSRPPLLVTHRGALGLGAFDAADGLAEAEPPALTAALDVEALGTYARAVHRAAADHLDAVDVTALATAADGPAGLSAAGVDEAAVPWLHAMWRDKPAAWFVQWEVIGHRVNHLGEMVSVRNRLGLSPF